MEQQSPILYKILAYFRHLSDIPRGSYNLDGVRTYLETFAKERAFEYQRDTYGNCVIFVGDKTNSSRKNVVIQSHMDMVCVKSEESTHDFTKDPIEFVFDGDILKANGTTLGADNGISLVASLVLAEELVKSDSTSKVNLYLLFTADEESGMLGVSELSTDPSFLPENAFVINVDSEIEHKVCAGSVGASETIITAEKYYQATMMGDVNPLLNNTCYSLSLKGFTGGHSGCDIHRGQYSSVKAMAHILYNVKSIKNNRFSLFEINAGSAHNAIPESCASRFCMNPVNEEKCREIINGVMKSAGDRYNEKNVTFTFEKVTDGLPRESVIGNELINLLMVLHQGPLSLSPFSLGNLSTSNNIGIIKTEADTITINCLTRSSSTGGLKEYYDQISAACEMVPLCSVNEFSCYEGWAPDWNSSTTLAHLKKAHQKLFGYECNPYVAHAGLELSTLVAKFPQWDAMSIGPQIDKAHTFKEQITVSSILPFYDWLYETVKQITA